MSIFLTLFLEKIAVPLFSTINVPFHIMYIKYCAAPNFQESLQNLIKNALRNILQIPEHIEDKKSGQQHNFC